MVRTRTRAPTCRGGSAFCEHGRSILVFLRAGELGRHTEALDLIGSYREDNLCMSPMGRLGLIIVMDHDNRHEQHENGR